MVGLSKPELLGFSDEDLDKTDTTEGEFERPEFMTQEDELEAESQRDSMILINITGEFDKDSIVNIENELQSSFEQLAGKEIEWKGYTVFFYDVDPTSTFQINFRTEGTFEQIGEKRARIIDLIHHFGGRLADNA